MIPISSCSAFQHWIATALQRYFFTSASIASFNAAIVSSCSDVTLIFIHNCVSPQDSIKVGLEATGHYSYNLLGFLLDSGFPTYVLNPLHTNLYWKSHSLRKTKTDKVDARTIAAMLLSDLGLKPYTDTAYHNEELKSLTRYRSDKVRERAKLKHSVSRLVCILFPELEKLVPTLYMNSVYALLEEFF